MKKKIFAAIAATCVVLASCGGDDSSSGGGDGLSGAVTEALAAQIALEGVDLGDEQIECIAGKLLENEDMNSALQAAYDEGKEGEELLDAVNDSDENEATATLMTLQCLPAEQIVDLLVGGLSTEGQITDEQRSCLIEEFEKIDSDELAEGFMEMAEGTGEGEAAGALTGAVVTCLGSDF